MANPTVTTLVDLGFAVARVKREKFVNGVFTTLTIMTPAMDGEGFHQPAASADAYIKAADMPALIEALQRDPGQPANGRAVE